MYSMFDSLARQFIFFPEKYLYFSPEQFGLTYNDVFLQTSDGVRIHGWHFPVEGPDAARGTLLFFHGNAGNISHRLENIKFLVDRGIPVFIVDYRGYGRSDGVITEQGMYRDAESAMDWLMNEMGIPAERVVIFGRSMGGVAAVHAASVRPAAGVILEATFSSLADASRIFFPILPAGLLLGGRMDSMAKIGKVRAPLLFIHGDKDDLIPIALGRKLFEAAPHPKEFYTLRGAGHNDTYIVGGEPYFHRIRSFVDQVTGGEDAR
jgi:fermentation-respiration switch protein FrsA (DUF1100 family)